MRREKIERDSYQRSRTAAERAMQADKSDHTSFGPVIDREAMGYPQQTAFATDGQSLSRVTMNGLYVSDRLADVSSGEPLTPPVYAKQLVNDRDGFLQTVECPSRPRATVVERRRVPCGPGRGASPGSFGRLFACPKR